MKVKLNWLDHRISVGMENGNFEKNGSNRNLLRNRTEFYIVKKDRKTIDDFSNLLMNEFNGLRIDQARQDSTAGRSLAANNESKAINFLNGYWA